MVKTLDQINGETQIREEIEENLDYSIWDRKDNTIKNWVYSSLTCNYLKHLVDKNTIAKGMYG